MRIMRWYAEQIAEIPGVKTKPFSTVWVIKEYGAYFNAYTGEISLKHLDKSMIGMWFERMKK